ncbi:hypothetical protein HaLaN_10490, partial [Haematococcus lacustris]
PLVAIAAAATTHRVSPATRELSDSARRLAALGPNTAAVGSAGSRTTGQATPDPRAGSTVMEDWQRELAGYKSQAG